MSTPMDAAPDSNTPPWQRGVRLLAVLAVVGGIWLGVLPRWAQKPAMRAALQTHTDRNINGSATYYTENPAALVAIRELQQLQKEQPQLFWHP